MLRAARELDDAATAFAQGRMQIDVLRDSVEAARHSLDIANLQYREGLVDFQRVLDSQRALFSQQERLVVSEGSVAQNLITVYKAMGGLAGRPAAACARRCDRSHDGRAQQLGNAAGAPLPPPATEFLPPLLEETR